MRRGGELWRVRVIERRRGKCTSRSPLSINDQHDSVLSLCRMGGMKIGRMGVGVEESGRGEEGPKLSR